MTIQELVGTQPNALIQMFNEGTVSIVVDNADETVPYAEREILSMYLRTTDLDFSGAVTLALLNAGFYVSSADASDGTSVFVEVFPLPA